MKDKVGSVDLLMGIWGVPIGWKLSEKLEMGSWAESDGVIELLCHRVGVQGVEQR